MLTKIRSLTNARSMRRSTVLGERVERPDDVVAVEPEVEREVVARPGGHADVRQIVLHRDLRDERLRAVAARHADHIGRASGLAGERSQVVAALEEDRLDPAPSSPRRPGRTSRPCRRPTWGSSAAPPCPAPPERTARAEGWTAAGCGRLAAWIAWRAREREHRARQARRGSARRSAPSAIIATAPPTSAATRAHDAGDPERTAPRDPDPTCGARDGQSDQHDEQGDDVPEDQEDERDDDRRRGDEREPRRHAGGEATARCFRFADMCVAF